MKSSLRIALAVLGLSMSIASFNAAAWGQKGHDVTCAIAERHLNCRARRKVAEIFDGKSMVYWANWLDNASHTPEFAYTKTWHYKNIDADETFDSAILCETGDVITAINAQIEALKSGKLNHEVEAIALRMLVHLVGDLHCPMHMGHRSDLGGNRWQLQFFNNGSNLHSIWDSGIVERAHAWTFSDWADQIDRVDRRTAKALCKGSIEDWARDTWSVAKDVYDRTPVGKKVSYDEVSYWSPVVEQQLLLGGLRLAAILNEIY